MYEYLQTVNNSVRNTNEYKKKLKPDFKIFMQMGKIKQIKTSVPKFLCAVTCGSNPEFFLGGGGGVRKFYKFEFSRSAYANSYFRN